PATVPGPYVWPIFGESFALIRYAAAFKINDLFEHYTRRYGPIYGLSFLGEHMVVVSDAAALKVLLNNTADFRRGDLFEKATIGLLDYGLFTLPSGDMWKRHRKLLQPAFGPAQLRQTVAATTSVVEAVAADFRAIMAQTGSTTIEVDAFEYMTALALDVIGQIAFSKDFGSVKDIHSHKHSEPSTDQHPLTRDAHLQRFDYPPFLWPLLGLDNNSSRVRGIRGYTQSFVKDMIAERRVAIESGDYVDKGKWDMDVLDRLLQASVNARDGEEEEIVGETLGLFFAGHETTSSSMTNILLALCQNPRVMAKVVDEIDAVYASLDGQITAENLHQFKYLDWVLKETSRLHNVASFYERVSNKPVELMGHRFPANTAFAINSSAVHLDPKYWKEPRSFLPERWAEPPVPGSYIPFGDGPMVCIGQKMAAIEMKVAMIHLLRQFSFAMVADQKLEVLMSITIGLKGGFKVLVTERA
ncbi:cytochrome P450, partial [Entophlyctis helioformis]